MKQASFTVSTPLGFDVHVTSDRWDLITTVKHPVMHGREKSLKAALEHPDEIRKSRSDPKVFLFYKLDRQNRWVCAVVKQVNSQGFLITAYPTDTMKIGETIWKK
jgi:hypothetical protein